MKKKYLKPGLEMKFFNNRLGVDFTYYWQNSKDQIIRLASSSASGYDKRLVNAGQIRNSGVELAINARAVQAGDFAWDLGLNFSKNNNKVKAIGAGLDYMLNMHNAFGGYNPDRRFWVNALAGVSYNYTSVYPGIHGHAFGYGGGLQANVRLSRDIDFVVEPRVDFYGNSYAPYANSSIRLVLKAVLPVPNLLPRMKPRVLRIKS